MQKITKYFFTSPYFLFLFLLIPAYTILGPRWHLHVSGNLLLINNGCFLLCIVARLARCVIGMRGDIRYGADYRQPTDVVALERPTSHLRQKMADAGYRFDSDGFYGEKRDLGYLGTALLYGGLAVLLFFGSYDYMREYSVMGRLGVGEPMPLDKSGLVGEIEAAALAGTKRLPLVQVRSQILPNQQWPKGATQIALLTKDRKELAKATIAPGKSFSYGGLDYHMTKFVFDALITIREGKFIIYESFVKFFPLAQNKGAYSYYGSLVGRDTGKVKGSVWLNPEKKAVLVEATLDGKKIVDTDLELWGENKKTQGNYVAAIEGLAQWSEMRVARTRHTMMLMIGGIIAILGAAMRLLIRPQRVWLEDADGGCRARAAGRKTMRLLQAE